MPGIIDTETLYVDKLPTIWSPVQWDLTPDEKAHEIEEQATASLLWAADIPETILRLLLDEHKIERSYEPPPGYDPEQQGEWDPDLLTFEFARPVRLEKFERNGDSVYIEYYLGDAGYWAFEIGPEKVTIQRI